MAIILEKVLAETDLIPLNSMPVFTKAKKSYFNQFKLVA